jgi:tetratricopeptide (TPR) repeat protein
MQTQAREAVGSLATALQHAAALLDRAPHLALEQAKEILRVVPRQPEATILMARAQLACGDSQTAGALLDSMPNADRRPDALRVRAEVEWSLGNEQAAVATLRRAIQLDANDARAWQRLADFLRWQGDSSGADRAHAEAVRTSVRDPQLMRAASALREGRPTEAETLLRDRLKAHPTDVAAIRMLAELAAQLGRYDDALVLLERVLELNPSFDAARHSYALLLQRQNRAADALIQIERLMKSAPTHPGYRLLQAAILVRLGEYAAAISIYQSLVEGRPKDGPIWTSLGHALKTVGRADEGTAAYRQAIDVAPSLGEAWWSLANLKTHRFTAADVATMRAQLESPNLRSEDRLHLHFALGKALEDGHHAQQAFDHYASGNTLRRAQLDYAAGETSMACDKARATFTPSFVESRRGSGCQDPDPIFIVGMPRSGSTLIEQILASHPLVEGTMELPDLLSIAHRLNGRGRSRDKAAGLYPGILETLDRDALKALGEEYLNRTRVQRKTDRPYFIDKMPNNWLHVGLIQAILPNAKIIDARRHPLACCFSNFKQHFARGQGFSYDLDDMGRYYADYVKLMSHMDSVLPGRVHRVFYENMVLDTEAQVRQMLQYCGLSFDLACLRFHETDRAVRTASAQQVRQPLFRHGMESWREYEPWLGPLKQALGEALTTYPITLENDDLGRIR